MLQVWFFKLWARAHKEVFCTNLDPSPFWLLKHKTLQAWFCKAWARAQREVLYKIVDEFMGSIKPHWCWLCSVCFHRQSCWRLACTATTLSATARPTTATRQGCAPAWKRVLQGSYLTGNLVALWKPIYNVNLSIDNFSTIKGRQRQRQTKKVVRQALQRHINSTSLIHVCTWIICDAPSKQ